jgi:hypothetical protein
MIFPVLEVEPIVQVGDKTRLNGTKSFASGESTAISLVRIRPEASASWVTVTGTDSRDWLLDWAYADAGTKTVSIEITTNGSPVTKTASVSVVTAATDKLFSTDSDLQLHETDILKWVPDGRSSFLDMHRRAQKIILQWLDKEGYVDVNQVPFTKAAIIDIEEVNAWSTYTVLRLIFESISNATDDIFHEKAIRYGKEELHARNRAVLRLDTDGDGQVDLSEELQLSTAFVARR